MGTHDQIRIDGLEIFASVGVYPHEHTLRQKLSVDLLLEADLRRAAADDSIEYSVDYDALAGLVTEVSESQHFRLLESLGARIAELVLSRFALVMRVSVQVAKPAAVPRARRVAVAITRQR